MVTHSGIGGHVNTHNTKTNSAGVHRSYNSVTGVAKTHTRQSAAQANQIIDEVVQRLTNQANHQQNIQVNQASRNSAHLAGGKSTSGV